MRARRRFLSPLLLVLVCFKICGVSSLQTFDREPVSTEVNPNSDTKLDCKVLNKKGSCSWQKDNKPVGIYEKKYEWVNSDPSSGDCSLWIRSATLEFDDGEWECQITASDFTTQDALTSRPVRLIVRVEPQPPRIEYKTSAVLPGHNVTVKAGERANVKCVSRYGNPPAKLKWFLGEEELVAKSNQSNSPEADNRRTWASVSVVEIAAEKPHNGRMLRCVALHESYPAKSVSVDVRLDVTYSPEVRLVGTPANDVEEGRDHVVLKCLTDSNPPASVIWRRVGKQEIASLEESLQFRPVFRRDSGTYTCQAQNSLGSSQPISVALDVKYAPDIESIRPDRVTTSQLFHPVTFTCTANGNPAPTYEWIQKIPTSIGGEYIEVIRSAESRLHIANITYEHQGEYFCRATNVISGSEKRKMSDGITLQVVGPPHIIRHVGGREIVVMRGEEALLRMVVCADPRPRNSTWLWGSVQVQPGTGVGKYQADDLNQDRREDCYEARLRITDADMADSRNYYLSVENDRGADKYGVHLAVREPLAMATLLTIATGCLLGFLLCVLLALYVIRSERCCFARKCRGDFRPTDLESEKSDIDSTMGRKTPRIEASMMGNGPMTLPSEAMYCTSPARRPHPQHTILAGNSPEAIKTEQDYEEDDEDEEDMMEDVQRNAKKRKSNSSGRSKRKHKKEPVNVFADLQVPSVSNNGCTMSSLHYYNKSYHKPYSTLDNHHNNSYERNRKVSYDANAYDKKIHDVYDRKPSYDKSSYDKSSYDKKLFQNSYDKKSYPNGFDSRIQSYVDPLRSSNHSYESGSNRGSKAFSSTSNLIDTSAYFAKQNHTASSNVSRFSHYDNVKNLRASSNNYQPRSFDKAEL